MVRRVREVLGVNNVYAAVALGVGATSVEVVDVAEAPESIVRDVNWK